ncbi:3-dehydroquinate synthase [Candidatus Photodesmus blepharus]|uniref:3-dehydroquinate synthase n=1 Tax=Candidatus Photodesmus blepharonis TaxID=1179155 RepID=A0A084CML9_9GAMM|nr:3-dehydroquinate synthase [Candidatus Photodesmus blepharus]KEY91048.1 3-dehydroquinate synthase [Candidatus Photodesmus blepharus]
MEQRIWVNLSERSYSILIGAGLFNDSTSLAFLKENRRSSKQQRVVVVSNVTVAPLYSGQILFLLKQLGCDASLLELPDGEQHKNLDTFNMVISYLLEGHYGRDVVIIALGGGVVGDLVGFSAACYHRGVDFIQIPTTLLSQVDSAVGGKTAINHSLGKNMIGAFHQPKSVVIDIEFLSTLPKREFASGIAEIIKYSVVCDACFFDWLELNLDRLYFFDKNALSFAILRCCQIKSKVITQDEKEFGVRTLLNLGHTFGHAIEVELGYGHWLHGEAVSSGMVIAAKIAQLQGFILEHQVERIISILKKAKLPVCIPAGILFGDFMKHIMCDKKVLSGELRLVLPTSIGTANVVTNVSESVLEQAVNYCRTL